MSSQLIYLDGYTLTPEILYSIGYENKRIALTKSAWKRVKEGRQVIDNVLESGQTVYGINTGFGLFSQVLISPSDLVKLQVNLIRSHAAGQGQYLTLERTRMLLALRINVLAKGHSGISDETLQQLCDALNHNCISCVPEKGTVGASGDLAPLAHLALGLLGEGEMWDLNDVDRKGKPQPKDAIVILKRNGLRRLNLKAKEGLALINGTQFITSLGCEALIRAEKIARQSDIVAAMSLEVQKGTVRAYTKCLHDARPHKGQSLSAARLRNLLHNPNNPSQIAMSHANCGQVQDAYTLRCAPQVHGIVHDTLAFVRHILTTELNSATDNPMIFRHEWYHGNDDDNNSNNNNNNNNNENNDGSNKNIIIDGPIEEDAIISGGNFHGEYPAKVLDFLAIAIHEMGNMSERRIERLNNPDLSHLPAFLVEQGGLNSGFMIPHCTAAALVSENKVLCHPSSVDSLSTSAAKEDHVSMGGFAARKAIYVTANVEKIIAIELMCACQGIDLLRPLKSTKLLEKVHSLVRVHVKKLDKDRFMTPDMNKIVELLKTNQVWECVKDGIPKQYHSLQPYMIPKLPSKL